MAPRSSLFTRTNRAQRGAFALLTLATFVAVVLTATALRAQQPSASAAAASTPVTFAKDVAPILQRSCQSCHRPDSIAPMSLLTYEEARPWARSIKAKVEARIMPPWHIDKHIGIQKFKDDLSLSDRDIATIVAWVDQGAPSGNLAEMPPTPKFPAAETWALGQPDLVVAMKEPYVVPATGSDQWRNFTIDLGLKEDRWVRAIQVIPGGRQVVHHATVVLNEPDADGNLPTDTSELAGGIFHSWSAGGNAEVFTNDTGKLLKAGTQIRLGQHYHPYGKPQADQTRIGLWFYPKGHRPAHEVKFTLAGMADELDIPAGEENHREDRFSRIDKPIKITSIQPHMHTRGKAMCMEVVYPESAKYPYLARTEMLNCVDRFQFAWHLIYNYADDAAPILPAGSVLHVISWFDNSANRSNPDPTNWIGWGNRSTDEMSTMITNYVELSEQEYEEAYAARTQKSVASN